MSSIKPLVVAVVLYLAVTGVTAMAIVHGAAPEPEQDRFDRLDVNRDGRVSLQEWAGDHVVFERLDLNRDGYLTRDELRRHGDAAGSFDRLDVNHDRRISLREWPGNRTTFDRLDLNHDGYLTRDELRRQAGGDRR